MDGAARPLRSLMLAPPPKLLGEVELRAARTGSARAAGAPLPDPPPQTAWGREKTSIAFRQAARCVRRGVRLTRAAPGPASIRRRRPTSRFHCRDFNRPAGGRARNSRNCARDAGRRAPHPASPRPVGEGRHRVPVAAISIARRGARTDPCFHRPVRLRPRPIHPASISAIRPLSNRTRGPRRARPCPASCAGRGAGRGCGP
jgi:hypothetical protein